MVVVEMATCALQFYLVALQLQLIVIAYQSILSSQHPGHFLHSATQCNLCCRLSRRCWLLYRATIAKFYLLAAYGRQTSDLATLGPRPPVDQVARRFAPRPQLPMSNLIICIFVCSVLCSLVCQVCPAIRTRVIHWYHDGMYSMGSPSLPPHLIIIP